MVIGVVQSAWKGKPTKLCQHSASIVEKYLGSPSAFLACRCCSNCLYFRCGSSPLCWLSVDQVHYCCAVFIKARKVSVPSHGSIRGIKPVRCARYRTCTQGGTSSQGKHLVSCTKTRRCLRIGSSRHQLLLEHLLGQYEKTESIFCGQVQKNFAVPRWCPHF